MSDSKYIQATSFFDSLMQFSKAAEEGYILDPDLPVSNFMGSYSFWVMPVVLEETQTAEVVLKDLYTKLTSEESKSVADLLFAPEHGEEKYEIQSEGQEDEQSTSSEVLQQTASENLSTDEPIRPELGTDDAQLESGDTLKRKPGRPKVIKN